MARVTRSALSRERTLASEVGGLLQQAIALGNSDVNGRYLFAGQANDQPPFSVQATVAQHRCARATPSGTLTPLGVGDLTINGREHTCDPGRR